MCATWPSLTSTSHKRTLCLNSMNVHQIRVASATYNHFPRAPSRCRCVQWCFKTPSTLILTLVCEVHSPTTPSRKHTLPTLLTPWNTSLTLAFTTTCPQNASTLMTSWDWEWSSCKIPHGLSNMKRTSLQLLHLVSQTVSVFQRIHN